MADAYRPILQGVLLPGSLYYAVITVGHWVNLTGTTLLIMAAMSSFTAMTYHMMRVRWVTSPRLTPAGLELIALAANFLMYANVAVHISLLYEQAMLIYFILMVVIFSLSGVTFRVMIVSVTVPLVTLYAYIRHLPLSDFNEFLFISIAALFGSIGMATLLRRAIFRQIEARISADEMAAEAQRLAQEAQRLANRDSLTDLPNRRSIFQRLEAHTTANQPFWFGVLDLDGFKSINDSYGHLIGDRLLVTVAGRINALVDDGIFIGRLAGDEFAVLVDGALSEKSVQEIGDGIIEAVSQPCEISNMRLTVGASLGFAHFPTMAATSQSLYEKSDYALYRAKESSRGRTLIFNMREQAEMNENSVIEQALRTADLEGEMYLVFQPQHHVGGNRVSGFEALARWQSPSLGSIRPDKFIRAAERSGLIQAITRILFRKGLAALDSWAPEITLSFNLSAQDLSDRAFVFSLVADVYEKAIDPGRIEFEVTETSVMTDIEASLQLLQDLSAAGFKIALDDFGSGYSSFEYIDKLPLNKVKIDKSFVRKIPYSDTSRQIVTGVIVLCRNLKLRCVLEGVETQEELQALLPLNPEIIQGYLFGKPMTLEDTTALLERQDLHERQTRNALQLAG